MKSAYTDTQARTKCQTQIYLFFFFYLFSFLLTINLKLIIVHVEIKIVNKEAATKRSTLLRRSFYLNLISEALSRKSRCRPLLTAPIGTNEIKRAINEIKQGKSAGTDGIYPEMIKSLWEKALALLAATISDIIKTSKYPESWKHAKIIVILKPKKPATTLVAADPLLY